MRQRRKASAPGLRGPGRTAASRSTAQLTLRGLEPRLFSEIRRLARAEGLSLNQAALRLLKRGAGLVEAKERRVVGDALLPWIGTWSRKEADDLLASIQSCAQVDPEMWA